MTQIESDHGQQDGELCIQFYKHIERHSSAVHVDQLYVIETKFCHLENEGPI